MCPGNGLSPGLGRARLDSLELTSTPCRPVHPCPQLLLLRCPALPSSYAPFWGHGTLKRGGEKVGVQAANLEKFLAFLQLLEQEVERALDQEPEKLRFRSQGRPCN